jgi:hypothetical protein
LPDGGTYPDPDPTQPKQHCRLHSQRPATCAGGFRASTPTSASKCTQFAADVVGARMVELIQDAQSFLPGFACGVGISDGHARVAELFEDNGAAVLVGELVAKLAGPMV